MRRQVSIDFELPAAQFEAEEGGDEGRTVLVPIMLLKNAMLRGLDVIDADGCSLEVIGSGRSTAIALAGVVDAIELFSEEELDGDARTALSDILRERPKQATYVAKRALAPGGELSVVLKRLTPSSDDRDSIAQARIIETLTALIEELIDGFLLLVAVPYRPGKPNLVKVSYDARIESSVRQFRARRGNVAALRLLFNRVFSSLGWVDVPSTSPNFPCAGPGATTPRSSPRPACTAKKRISASTVDL